MLVAVPEETDEEVGEVYPNVLPPDVCVVNTLDAARRVVEQLMAPGVADRYVFGCDTEVMDIDVTEHSPCCHGRVICFSVYAGPGLDFGEAQLQPADGSSSAGDGSSTGGGDAAPRQSMLWVDTWLDGDEARAGEAAAILEAFRPFWESAAHRKIWHNYSFDRHVLERMGLRLAGFAADTMHLARLWDSSRTGSGGGYSLEALSSEGRGGGGGRGVVVGLGGRPGAGEAKGGLALLACEGAGLSAFTPSPRSSPGGAGDEKLMGEGSDRWGKVSMKKIFGRPNIKKDGTPGKVRSAHVVRTVCAPQRSLSVRAPSSPPVPLMHAPPPPPSQSPVPAPARRTAHGDASCGGAAAWRGHAVDVGELLGLRRQEHVGPVPRPAPRAHHQARAAGRRGGARLPAGALLCGHEAACRARGRRYPGAPSLRLARWHARQRCCPPPPCARLRRRV